MSNTTLAQQLYEKLRAAMPSGVDEFFENNLHVIRLTDNEVDSFTVMFAADLCEAEVSCTSMVDYEDRVHISYAYLDRADFEPGYKPLPAATLLEFLQ